MPTPGETLALVVLLPLLFALPVGAQPAGDPALDALCRDLHETALRNDPTWATYLGDRRYDDRLPENGEAGRARRRQENLEFQKRLDAVAAASLSPGERVTREVIALSLAREREADAHAFYLWAVDQMFGPQVWLFDLLNSHPTRTEKNLQDFAARLAAFPGWLANYLADLEAGAATGRTAPRVAVERVIVQLRAIADTPAASSPIAAVLERIPADLGPAAREALLARLTIAIDGVLAAYRDWLTRFERDYLPRSRASVGISTMPGGPEAYRFLVRKHTTTERSPEELHRTGEEELARIHGEMRAVGRRLGIDLAVPELIARMRGDRKNFATTREELLAGYTAILGEATERLPKWFGRLPKAPCEVKALESYREKDSPAAFYYSPPEDGSRPAYYYANTYDPGSRPLYNMRALTVHEAVPGHHLQIALAQELTGLPAVRRHASFTAFVEGWALYSERLADEMGLYPDDLSRFGMLTYQAWRAARLVVDTGIHAFGWERARAIEFMQKNVALSDGEIANEIDRYIIWPGQALAYKVGQLEIERLRARATKELGPRFDIRRFHDAILENGAVPLATLERILGEWTERERSR